MADLLQHLKEFNRKERFYLIGMALGNKSFMLSCEFRKILGQKLNLEIPEDAFVAMDYHLDWLVASLYLAANAQAKPPYPRDRRLITATQEDIDLLVAYESPGGCHVIMLEAKGVTGFTNAQFSSKVERLRAISDVLGWQTATAIPHFVLISPRPPQQLKFEHCPNWMLQPDGQVPWIPLPLPEFLKKVVRCDKGENPNREEPYWTVVTEPHHKTQSSDY